jgi:hypothetical protein
MGQGYVPTQLFGRADRFERQDQYLSAQRYVTSLVMQAIERRDEAALAKEGSVRRGRSRKKI